MKIMIRHCGLTQLITWDVFSKSLDRIDIILPDPPSYCGQEGEINFMAFIVKMVDFLFRIYRKHKRNTKWRINERSQITTPR